jgi:hypothetical protein
MKFVKPERTSIWVADLCLEVIVLGLDVVLNNEVSVCLQCSSYIGDLTRIPDR